MCECVDCNPEEVEVKRPHHDRFPHARKTAALPDEGCCSLGAEIKVPGHIGSAMCRTSEAVERVQLLVNRLESKLSPVLAPPFPVNTGRDDAPDSGVELAEAILRHAYCLEEIALQLEAIHERTEI